MFTVCGLMWPFKKNIGNNNKKIISPSLSVGSNYIKIT